MFNECAVFVACFMMLTFTQNINDAVIDTTIQDRRFIGYLLCMVTLVVILVNLLAISHSIFW